MQIVNELPDKYEFFALFQTTGWDLKFTVDSLFEAISNSWYVLSAYEDGELVGFGRVVSDGVYQAMICDLIVLPDYQGNRIGSRILEELLRKCEQHSIRMVVLMSAKGKAGFYKRFGFVERDSEAPGMIWRGR
ncbi:GNAT family N-acetyltransferase [Pseudalkalibacillus sp. Hm43]|uniref:GNAT family N-acetyltransferase n=1 Tax=Pseudalkalibacillus sp. Hm43 TaxID=3450742 RepID=UPI003F434DC7